MVRTHSSHSDVNANQSPIFPDYLSVVPIPAEARTRNVKNGVEFCTGAGFPCVSPIRLHLEEGCALQDGCLNELKEMDV